MSAEFILELFKKNIDIEAQDQCGRTLLHLAGANDCISMTNVLIISGANVLAQDKWLCTPVHLALSNNKSSNSADIMMVIRAENKIYNALHIQDKWGVGITDLLVMKILGGLSVVKELNQGVIYDDGMVVKIRHRENGMRDGEYEIKKDQLDALIAKIPNLEQRERDLDYILKIGQCEPSTLYDPDTFTGAFLSSFFSTMCAHEDAYLQEVKEAKSKMANATHEYNSVSHLL